jgi:catechol 2,3-dioxygenase-like lactoylglutathione lyase family enzyme
MIKVAMKYVHTNIICSNIQTISDFYINVFGCKQIGSETKMAGGWVEQGTGIKKAEARAVNLQLPGYEKGGPMLEIFQYTETLELERLPKGNSKGLRHLAFSTDDVQQTLHKVLENGGHKLGELVSKEFKSGTLTYIYVTDPEGNIVEIQNWAPKA